MCVWSLIVANIGVMKAECATTMWDNTGEKAAHQRLPEGGDHQRSLETPPAVVPQGVYHLKQEPRFLRLFNWKSCMDIFQREEMLYVVRTCY
jgi:hypothetical protein